MQVLVKNPFTPVLTVPGTLESFWHPSCLYMDQDFSFGKALELTSVLKHSPFLTLDPKVAFLISQADAKASYCRGVGSLGAIGLHFFTGQKIIREDDGKQFDKYVREYLSESPFVENMEFQQVVVYGQNKVDKSLWEKLPVGGSYLMAFNEGKFDSNDVKFEAFGKLWPFGESTEFGWQFKEEDWGLQGLQFLKIRKLS